MYRNYIDESAATKPYGTNFWVSFTFMVLFVLFVYGGMVLALVELANMFIHIYHIDILLSWGAQGVFCMAVIVLLAWWLVFWLPAACTRYVLYHKARVRLANKIFAIWMFVGFHIFLLPIILWPVLRRASPYLRTRRRKKLKAMLKDQDLVNLRRRELQMQAQRRLQKYPLSAIL